MALWKAAERLLRFSQVYRDKSGKRYASKEEFEKSRDAEREKKKAQRVTPEWGTGLAQQRAAQEAAEAMRQQAAQPFARTRSSMQIPAAFSTICTEDPHFLPLSFLRSYRVTHLSGDGHGPEAFGLQDC